MPAQTLMHCSPRRPTQCLRQTPVPAPPSPFRQVIRSPGRHGSIRATREAALQALAETKARVSQAMEDTVAIKSGDSIDEAPGELTPGPMPQPSPFMQHLSARRCSLSFTDAFHGWERNSCPRSALHDSARAQHALWARLTDMVGCVFRA